MYRASCRLLHFSAALLMRPSLLAAYLKVSVHRFLIIIIVFPPPPPPKKKKFDIIGIFGNGRYYSYSVK